MTNERVLSRELILSPRIGGDKGNKIASHTLVLDDGVPGAPPGMMGVDGAPETTKTNCNLKEQIN